MTAPLLRTLGLDLGTNSLGWCLLETEGEPGAHDRGRVVDVGVRIFSPTEMAGRDPRSQESLAVSRRIARGMRRRRDRYLRRRARLLALLTELGLMPEAPDARTALLRATDDGPGGDLSATALALRAKALDGPLEPHELGRALFQLSQRRGFKSNRRTDSNDPEEGLIASGVTRLETALAEDGARTFGEWLHKRRQAGLSVRARLTSDGKAYDFYPSRDALEREFDRIMAAQRPYHPDILDAATIAELRETIFFQRPLRPVTPGRCSYVPTEERLPKAHPLFQAFRLLKEVNELEIVGEDQQHTKLTPDQRDALLLHLRTDLTKQGKAPFAKLRKTLKLPREMRFNKETDTRKDLLGDVVHFALSRPERFGPGWGDLPLERRAEIVERLRTEQDKGALVDWLMRDCGLSRAAAGDVADLPLPQGFGRLGPSALSALIDEMTRGRDDDGFVLTEAAAARNVYGRTNAEDDPDRKALTRLPKYQEILERHIPPGTGGTADPAAPEWDEVMGRITNPTVHIALNQLRRVVNRILDRHGRPDRIAIELGRDLKLNDARREDVNRRLAQTTREAQRLSELLTHTYQKSDTGYNRLRLRLWEELNPDQPVNRVCVYCGRAISAGMLFNGETAIDHILPYSKTLDDGQSNKVLCCTPCNNAKANRPPADVPQWQAGYDDILARAVVLPKAKQWRFAQDAMERFGDEEGFKDRQLTDTQYISRLALTYLAALYDAEEPDIDGVFRRHSRVRALPGRMTEMLRRKWGLNDLLADHNLAETGKVKNRLDHRHHAIDAAVIAATSRSMIQRIQTASRQAEDSAAERAVAEIAPPWPEFRNDLRERLRAVTVSHKPDHGTVSRKGYAQGRGQTAGKLHNDTAYGPTSDVDARGNALVSRRVAISSFENAKQLEAIRGNEHGHSELRDRLMAATRGLSGKAFQEAVQRFVETDEKFKGIRRVRIVEARSPVWITHGENGRHRKGYLPGENLRYDVWELPDGRWDAEVVSLFEAHQPGFVPRMRQEHHNPRKIMSLMKGDMVAYDHPETGERVIAKVRKFDQTGKSLYLDPHFEAGNLVNREKEKTYKPFRPMPNPLKKVRPRQVRVDEIGQVFDPGPWWAREGD
ncbi:type II CRISPR RNA-guided endonuclease Cas9 [Stappia sp.]|uniref:type II CRISPR RNA-guided endonuclease Cas9 n=1 Tax=Stappia sp. TaxID=1870903 RepID=UPI0032D8E228